MKKGKRSIKGSKARTVIPIIKRKGHEQPYDERKVYASCYFSCRNAHLSEKEAEKICEKITREITKQVKKEKSVTSQNIFQLIIKELNKHDKDAAFLYETHRDIS